MVAPAKKEHEEKAKIESLEKSLADLQQGLCLIQDYHHDLEKTA